MTHHALAASLSLIARFIEPLAGCLAGSASFALAVAIASARARSSGDVIHVRGVVFEHRAFVRQELVRPDPDGRASA